MDRSRLDDDSVGCMVVWKKEQDGEWKNKRYHLGKGKKVFDAECYDILEAIRMVALRSDSEELENVTVISHSTTTIMRVHHTRPGSGHSITILTVGYKNILFAKGIQVVY
jgi:hypothetical protein